MNRRKILLVDDEPAFRNALSRLLATSDYEIHTASDGLEASEKLIKEEPHLVVLDLNMATMNGFLVLSFIRDTPHLSSTKVIVLSGLDQDTIDRAKGLGADAAFQKPIDNKELLACITDLMSSED